MSNDLPAGWGTLTVDCKGAPLPVEVVARGPVKVDEPAPSLQGVTGREMALPPGEYLVKAMLPTLASQSQSSVTVPVHVGTGERILKDLSDVIVERLTSIDVKTTLPVIGAPVSFRPANRQASERPALEAEVVLPLGVTMKYTIEADTMRGILDTGGQFVGDTLSGAAQMAYAAWEYFFPPSPGTAQADAPTTEAQEVIGPESGAAGRHHHHVTLPAIDRFEGIDGWLTAAWSGKSVLAVVPVDRSGSTTASLSASQDNVSHFTPPQLELAFSDPELNTLWLFMRVGALSESRQLASNVPGTAGWPQGELEVLRRSPLTATLEAYILLRANWRDELCEFTRLALKENPDLPDIRVVRAEVLGRMGQHGEAAAVLACLGHGSSPWPVFRLGMSYALARARLYLEVDEVPGMDELVRKTLQPLQDRLSRICAAADPNQIPIVLSDSKGTSTLQELLSGFQT